MMGIHETLLFSEAVSGALLRKGIGRKRKGRSWGERVGKDAVYPVVRLPSIHQQRWNWQPQSTQGEILGSSCLTGI